MSQGLGRVPRRSRVPPLPRDAGRVALLRRSLALQRLAIGQPPQDDLLEFSPGEVPGDPRDDPPAPLPIRMSPPHWTRTNHRAFANSTGPTLVRVGYTSKQPSLKRTCR